MQLYVYLIATILHDQITKIGISKLFILVHGAGLASWLFLSPYVVMHLRSKEYHDMQACMHI